MVNEIKIRYKRIFVIQGNLEDVKTEINKFLKEGVICKDCIRIDIKPLPVKFSIWTFFGTIYSNKFLGLVEFIEDNTVTQY